MKPYVFRPQVPGSAGYNIARQFITNCQVGCPIRRSGDQSLFPAPPRLSQSITSFIASCCQGIHQTPFSRLIRSRKRQAVVIFALPPCGYLSATTVTPRGWFDPRLSSEPKAYFPALPAGTRNADGRRPLAEREEHSCIRSREHNWVSVLDLEIACSAVEPPGPPYSARPHAI